MKHYLDEWVTRKRARRLVSICEPRTCRYKFRRCLGPRSQYAVVQLLGEPADDFKFESLVTWPLDDCTSAILEAILDELFASGNGFTPAKVSFTLLAIEWHDVDSSVNAFYHAARGAVREILGLEKSSYNIAWERI